MTAQVLRAVKKFKGGKLNTCTIVTPEELAEAEGLWITSAQQQLVLGRDFKFQQRQFNLFQDEEGVWRCKGRLSNAEVPYAVKHPILLPKAHPLTTLIVRRAHERVCHNGVKETLTETRRRFWIPRGRSLTKYIVRRCVLCRRLEGTPFKTPPPPPLPTFRVKDDPAFTYTGVDFAGPLSIRASGMSTTSKVWICLFTCFVTRAVHLDIVSDQSTQTFIRCLKRFAARRGLARKFISDNGKTFKAAAKYIKAVFKDGTVKEYLAGQGSEWLFNIERAPWWGGAFERMVKSTKRCLRKMVGRAHFSFDELLTALTEIESVINSRPLSYVSANDLEEPLTPSHLLVGRRILNLPDHLGFPYDLGDEDFSTDSTQLTRRMRHLNNTLNHFWHRWRSEYLSELREAHCRSGRTNLSVKHPNLSVGEVVIVHDEHLPRGLWKLGRIQEVMMGRDGQIRGATVRMAVRDRQQVLLRRPIQLLYPLEVKCQDNRETPPSEAEEPEKATNKVSPPALSHNEPTVGGGNADHPPETRRRSQRVAAQRADERRKACMFELEDS